MAQLDQLDDPDLLGRVAQKDRRAMEILYKRHYPRLSGYARGMVKDHAAGADVVQETMMVVWRKAGEFEGKSSVKTWIFSIARFKAMDVLRARSRLQTDDDIPEEADDAPTPEAAAMAAADARRVRACLDALDPKRRAAVRLAFFEDMTYEEISAVEGIATGTIKSRIHAAKKLLMRCLGRT